MFSIPLKKVTLALKFFGVFHRRRHKERFFEQSAEKCYI